MKSLVNNCTTYNYLYYATRPKWLITFVNSSQKTLKNDNKQNRHFLNKLEFTNRNFVKTQTNHFLTLWSLCDQALLRKTKLLSKSKGKKNIKIEAQRATQPLFQAKELLCWTSDLSFFNLRGYFSNILKALQVCRVAARNNRKVLFIKGTNSSYAHSTRLNPWLQPQRQMLPQTLCSIHAPYLNPRKSIFFEQSYKSLFYQINTLRNTSFKKVLLKQKTKQYIGGVGTHPSQNNEAYPNLINRQTALTKNCAAKRPRVLTEFQSRDKRRCFYQLSGLLSSHFTKLRQGNETVGTPSLVKRGTTELRTQNLFAFTSSLYKVSNKHSVIKNQGKKKEIKSRISNVIKLRIKEAQIMSQQTAGVQFNNSLAGVLTNSKTTFNTAYSLSNYNCYYSIFTNEALNKQSSFWSPRKVKTDRLEKMLPLFIQETKTKYKDTVQRSPSNDSCASYSLAKPKEGIRSKFLDLYTPKNTKKQWAEHSYHHHYLFLASSVCGNITLNAEKTKKQKLVEYGALGDVFAWQPKSHEISSAFYSSSRNRKVKTVTTKQPRLLESRPPISTATLSGFFRMSQITDLKQKIVKGRFRFGLMGQFIMFTSALTKGNLAFLKRAKKKMKKQGSFLKHAKSNKKNIVFAPFLSVGDLLDENAATFLDKGKRCKHIITYKTNPKTKSTTTYWYNVAQKTRFTFFNKKSIKKEHAAVLTSSQVKGKGVTSEGLQNKVKIRAFKNHKFCLVRLSSFCKYYKTIAALNYLKQYEMFVKTPFANNQLADILFFINPEKTYNVVNQANSLKIPTVGIVSGITMNSRGRQSYNSSRLRESVNYPILGNPASYFFIRTIIHLFVKAFQTQNYKTKK